MTDQTTGPKLRSLDDLQAAMTGAVGGRCERCRRETATLTLNAKLSEPRRRQGGNMPTLVGISAKVCEQCGVEIMAVVGRAVGSVR